MRQTRRISRPALRYHGGKFRIASWIESYFPDHDCYIEPFGGAMSVLLCKKQSPIEIYNDIDGVIVNFFAMLRDRSSELIRAIQLTPCDDPIESARRFYVRSWLSIGCASNSRSGLRIVKSSKGYHHLPDEFANVEHLQAIASRLKQVAIECGDARDVIQRYDSPQALFYIDPPYLHSTRSSHRYNCDIEDEMHLAIAQEVNAISGMAIVSGYDEPRYASWYEGWTKASRQTSSNGGAKTECLWISPRAANSIDQLSLNFEGKFDRADESRSCRAFRIRI